jgi:cytochrome c peroxidase
MSLTFSYGRPPRQGGRPVSSLCFKAAALAAAFLSLGAKPPVREPADVVQARYARDAAAFEALTPAFRKAVDSLPARAASTASLRTRVARLRAAYKRVEWLADYAHPGSAARLNPPPLDRADLNAPSDMTVLKPEGLQILLEVAHGENPLQDRGELKRLAMRLESAAGELAAQSSSTVLDDRMVFEAMQNQVLRVMAAGITGFDAPATELSLPESRLSLEALHPALALYLPELKRRDAALAARLTKSLDRAVKVLAAGKDFDAFDRLAFIREAGNPLYAALADAQVALGIATFADLKPLRRPVSVQARNLFDPGFLDGHFYAHTPGETLNPAVAAVGRRLFFDPAFSSDQKRSCASCHDPRRAFSDGVPKSPAFGGLGTLLRNAPGISHAAYQGAQFWDLREQTLEKQIGHVIAGEGEFRSSTLATLGAVRKGPGYVEAFRAAFPGDPDPVNMGTITKALAMYVRSLARWDSPFDRYARGETEFIDPAAKRGFNLFMGKAACATCHFPPAFNGVVPPKYLETESEVIGAPARFPAPVLVLDPDLGRGLIHQNPIFRNAFKTPTVRNAELTGPYMHNGGIETLEAVLDFYNAGGGAGLGLEVPNQTLPSDSLGLSRAEMNDIIAFMKSLTDTTGYGGQIPAGY